MANQATPRRVCFHHPSTTRNIPTMPPLERQVLDALPITIYTVDLDGRITFMNRSWSRFAQSNGAPQLCDEGTVIGT